MIDVSACKAKDPTKCPYHGAALRMVAANEAGDLDKYFEARKEFEAAEAKIKRGSFLGFSKKEQLIPKDSIKNVSTAALEEVESAAVRAEHRAAAEKLVREKERRQANRRNISQSSRSQGPAQRDQAAVDYLKTSQAIPTPLEAYALWLEIYVQQGGKVTFAFESDYLSKATVLDNGAIISGKEEWTPVESYETLAWGNWTPTKSGATIPVNYGSSAMELLVLPDMVDQKLDKTSNDTRSGWEFGHTIVLTLERDSSAPSGFRALTNNPNKVTTYPDVEKLRKGKSTQELATLLTKKPTGAAELD